MPLFLSGLKRIDPILNYTNIKYIIMKRILFLLAVLISMTVQSQIIYTFDAKTPIYGGDLLLGTDSLTLATSNFKVSDISKYAFGVFGKDTVILTTQDYGWLSSNGDPISTAFTNLNAFAVNTHLSQTIAGNKTFDGASIFNGAVDFYSGVNILRGSNPNITFFDASGDAIGLIASPVDGLLYTNPSVGSQSILLSQNSVIAGSNIVVTNTATGIQISATGTISSNEEDVNITGTYTNLGISPGQTQKSFNLAADTQIGTNTSGISTNAGNIANKADKSNVLELNNASAFTPDADYEPATKKYVDDKAGDISIAYIASIDGNTGVEDFSKSGIGVSITSGRTTTGLYTITHNFGDLNYTVQCTCINSIAKNVTVFSYTNNIITIEIEENGTPTAVDSDFFITIFR